MNSHWRDMLAQSVLAVSSRQRQRGKFGGSPTLARNCDEIPNIIERGCKIFRAHRRSNPATLDR
jgi:hypothetical protein